MADKKYVYFFGDGKAEGRGDMKDLLGGKGANLAEMTNLGLPVPQGFTITTEAREVKGTTTDVIKMTTAAKRDKIFLIFKASPPLENIQKHILTDYICYYDTTKPE